MTEGTPSWVRVWTATLLTMILVVAWGRMVVEPTRAAAERAVTAACLSWGQTLRAEKARERMARAVLRDAPWSTVADSAAAERVRRTADRTERLLKEACGR